ncbi:thrombomodulin-like [Petromyzon marinus]|uniref:thrombomodulin-like n=1 Tax=Petromyzon marinus TaxID=7757 RepID=UPI003F6EF203
MCSCSETMRCSSTTLQRNISFNKTAAGFIMLVVILSLLSLASAQQPQGPHIAHSLCYGQTCYSLHLERVAFLAAHKACQGRGGMLTTMKTTEETSLLQELLINFHTHREAQLGAAPARKLWIGLRRNRRQCYAPKKPLRGFYWLYRDEETSYSNWAKEPGGPCTVERCVTAGYTQAEITDGSPSLKWEDGNCNAPAMFVCKYTYRGMCEPFHLRAGASITYQVAFGVTDQDFGMYPEGSTGSVVCAGSDKVVEVTCELVDQEFGWTGAFLDPPCELEASEDSEDDDAEELVSLPVSSEEDAEDKAGCDVDNGGCEHRCVQEEEEEGAHRCECIQGYLLDEEDERSCVDVDECGDGELPCEQRCINTEGSYHCACERGFEMLEGHTCADIDECEGFPCEQFCENTPGSFACYCADGFTLDASNKRDCVHYDPCSLGAELCEYACRLAQRGEPECYCGPGYALHENGANCTDVDECESSPCAQACFNVPGTFQCSCEEGFSLLKDGVGCVPKEGFAIFAATAVEDEDEVELAATEYADLNELSEDENETTELGLLTEMTRPAEYPVRPTHTAAYPVGPTHTAAYTVRPTRRSAYAAVATVTSEINVDEHTAGGETSTWPAVTYERDRRPQGTGSARATEERNSKPWLLVAIIFAGLLIVTVTTFLCFAKRGGRKRPAQSGPSSAPAGAQTGVPLTKTEGLAGGPLDSSADVNETSANNEDLTMQTSLQNGS